MLHYFLNARTGRRFREKEGADVEADDDALDEEEDDEIDDAGGGAAAGASKLPSGKPKFANKQQWIKGQRSAMAARGRAAQAALSGNKKTLKRIRETAADHSDDDDDDDDMDEDDEDDDDDDGQR